MQSASQQDITGKQAQTKGNRVLMLEKMTEELVRKGKKQIPSVLSVGKKLKTRKKCN